MIDETGNTHKRLSFFYYKINNNPYEIMNWSSKAQTQADAFMQKYSKNKYQLKGWLCHFQSSAPARLTSVVANIAQSFLLLQNCEIKLVINGASHQIDILLIGL